MFQLKQYFFFLHSEFQPKIQFKGKRNFHKNFADKNNHKIMEEIVFEVRPAQFGDINGIFQLSFLTSV